MKKTYSVVSTYNDMRIDRWIRNNLGNLPQGLIEKNLRNGKIKLNDTLKISLNFLKTKNFKENELNNLSFNLKSNNNNYWT